MRDADLCEEEMSLVSHGSLCEEKTDLIFQCLICERETGFVSHNAQCVRERFLRLSYISYGRVGGQFISVRESLIF